MRRRYLRCHQAAGALGSEISLIGFDKLKVKASLDGESGIGRSTGSARTTFITFRIPCAGSENPFVPANPKFGVSLKIYATNADGGAGENIDPKR